MNPIEVLRDRIKRSIPRVVAKMDEPADRAGGRWYLDLKHKGHKVVVEWARKKGFGVSASLLDDGYGEGPEEVYKDLSATAKRVIELLRERRNTRPPRPVLLRELRALTHLTQEQLAERLGVRQGAVSRMEQRKDMTVSTLSRVIEAMGGKLEIVARFPNEAIPISQFGERAPDQKP